jgi:hypothetical protein
MQASTGRTEKRLAKGVEVTSYRSDGSRLPEGTFTDNVSMRGARILTKSQPLFGGKFAAGVEMQTQNSPETPKDKSRNLF